MSIDEEAIEVTIERREMSNIGRFLRPIFIFVGTDTTTLVILRVKEIIERFF